MYKRTQMIFLLYVQTFPYTFTEQKEIKLERGEQSFPQPTIHMKPRTLLIQDPN